MTAAFIDHRRAATQTFLPGRNPLFYLQKHSGAALSDGAAAGPITLSLPLHDATGIQVDLDGHLATLPHRRRLVGVADTLKPADVRVALGTERIEGRGRVLL